MENDKNHRNRTTGRATEHLLIIKCITTLVAGILK
jgi:hypothetical protein